MDNTVNNTHFVQFENRKIPKFLEVKNKEWITYGEKNDYPYYLNELYMRSSYNCAIINGKVKYICGAGWTYDKYGVNTLSQRAYAEKVIKQPFAETSLNESTFRWVQDLEKFNGFCILVQWAKNSRSAVLSYLDFSNVRCNSDRTEFYYTRGWYTMDHTGKKKQNKNPEKEKDFVTYKTYDPKNRSGNQIYYFSTYHADQYVYPIPSYVGGITWIENHIRYTDFQHKNISASFSPAKVINIYGQVPTEDKQEEIVAGMKRNFTGEEGERIVINFAPNKETGIVAEDSIVEDQSTLYAEIADQALQNIFTSHEITSPMLFGIRTEGQLGGRSEMLDAYEIFYNTYVKQRQQIIEQVINEIGSDLGLGIKLKLNSNSPINTSDILSPEKQAILNAINALSPLVATKVLESMSVEEIRGLVGLKGAIKSVSETTMSKFLSAKVDMFAQFGVDAALYEEVESRDVPTTDPLQLEKFENDYLFLGFASEAKIKSVDRSVLDLLTKDPFMPVEEMAKAIKVPPYQIRDAVNRLSERELITPSKETIAGEPVRSYDVAKDAANILDQQPAKTQAYKVLYKYDVASGMGDPIIDGTRDFCRRLIKLNRLYSREEINTMSEREDRNVWTLRGGWYNNDGINQPQCRHTWRQIIVKEK